MAAVRTPSAPATAEARPVSRRRAWAVLALIAIPVFVGSLDLTIVSAFLPEIIVNLQLPVESIINDAAWIVTGYLLAYTISMTIMGRVSDLVGRRTAFTVCLIIFMFGSFIVAEVDPNARDGVAGLLYDLIYRIQGTRPDSGSVALLTIIIGRVIQALGAGAIVPVSLALVGDLFPAARRAQPLGLVGAIDTLGWVLGHLYGGIMVRWFATNADGFTAFFQSLGLNWPAPDWRALFWINLPVSLFALVATVWALRGVPQTRARGRFDLAGAVLVSIALVALVIGLGANIEVSSTTRNFEELGGLPAYAVPVLGLSALALVLFIVRERRASYPLIDLRQFAKRNVSMGALANLLVGFMLMIGLVAVPILVNVRLPDASFLSQAALQVGILLSALTVPMALAAVPGGFLSERVGYARAAGAGFVLAAIGFTWMALTWTSDVADGLVAVQMAFIGVGLGLTFSPISAAVINSAEQQGLGSASALVIIMRLLGMTVSVTLLTAFASQRLAVLAGEELGGLNLDPFAAIDVYARLTVQVLAEMGWAGAILAVLALVPALRLISLRAAPGAAPTAEGPRS
jgi:MFS family permease